MNPFNQIYAILFENYGPQGWWPLLDCKGVNPTKTGSMNGYHPGDYSYPKNKLQQFEIALGAIATQNTSWVQAEKALVNLKTLGGLSPLSIKEIDLSKLALALKPSGYFNQKATKMKALASFWLDLKGTPTRLELLEVFGVGPETADSILLYALGRPSFVIDAYTRRIFSRMGLIGKEDSYDSIKARFEKALTPSVPQYQEYHALIVEHAKRSCKSKPECDGCILNKICRNKRSSLVQK